MTREPHITFLLSLWRCLAICLASSVFPATSSKRLMADVSPQVSTPLAYSRGSEEEKHHGVIVIGPSHLPPANGSCSSSDGTLLSNHVSPQALFKGVPPPFFQLLLALTTLQLKKKDMRGWICCVFKSYVHHSQNTFMAASSKMALISSLVQ